MRGMGFEIVAVAFLVAVPAAAAAQDPSTDTTRFAPDAFLDPAARVRAGDADKPGQGLGSAERLPDGHLV